MKTSTFAACLLVACGGAAPTPSVTPAVGEGNRAAESAAQEQAGTGAESAAAEREASFPFARREDVVEEIHGVEVHDPYRWLEDAAKPEAMRWIDAHDEVARKTLAARPLRKALAARFTELFYLDWMSPPYHRAGRYFYSRRHKDKEKTVYYWRQGEKGKERLLLDPNVMSEDGSVSLHGYSISWNGKKVAYTLSKNNADQATLYVRDLATGKDSEVDVITGARYAYASWTPDHKGFYYVWQPLDRGISEEELPGHNELRYHRLGTDPAADPQVFPPTGDPRTFLSGGVTKDGRWLVVEVQSGWHRNEVYVKDLKKRHRKVEVTPEKPLESMSTWERFAFHASERGFVPLVAGIDAFFDVGWFKGYFYVRTDHEAPNFRVLRIHPQRMSIDRAEEIVAESDAAMDGMQIIGGRLVLSYLRNAHNELEVRRLNGKLVRKVELPGLGSTGGLLGNDDEPDAYFTYSSYTEPKQVYKTSVKTGKTTLWSELELPIDTSKMTAEQVWYTAKDGTKVSMFVVHNKDMKKDGSTPALLEGYGGFNYSASPWFSSSIAVWLEQGGVYAYPNLRGGGEYGEKWHRAGMLENKQNVFDDFIAAAEYLIAQGYTSPDKLAISGASNGGLLVGAAMVQRPDLFRAVVCGVPLLDMVRYHRFGTGKTWVPEYGSAEDPTQFEYLYAYSPYHHVVKGTNYPALLMETVDSDDRVHRMHATKFTAAILWATASKDRPVLMRVERNAGHGGSDRIKSYVEASADEYAFLLWQLAGR